MVAKTALLERIAQSPGDIDALVKLAQIASSDKNPDEALSFIQDVLILDPGNESALALKNRIARGKYA